MKAFLKRLFLSQNRSMCDGDVVYRWGDDTITWQNILMGGILGCGMTGSGKTTSFLLLLDAMLASSPGSDASDVSLVATTAKPSDIHDLYRLWRKHQDRYDFIHVHAGSGHTFNLLQYEVSRPGGSPQSAASLLKILNEVALKSQSQGASDESFWANLFYELLFNAITLVKLAKGIVTIPDVYQVILGAPHSIEQAMSDPWTRQSVCGQFLAQAAQTIKTAAEERQLKRCIDFFLREISSIGDRARGAALNMVNGTLAKFLAEPFHDLLCVEQSNLLPESLFTEERPRIIVLDFPVLVYGEAGRFFQTLFTMLVQQACLRRNVNRFPRPVILYRDEAQLFLHGTHDAQVQSVARSARLIDIALFQSLPTLVGIGLGGNERARLEAASFISNHANHFIYANLCSETNQHFAELIGQSRKLYFGGSSPSEKQNGTFFDQLLGVGGKPSVSWHEQLDFNCPPSEFLKLRTGGPLHHYLVDAIWFQGGRRFASGKSFRKVTFQQEFGYETATST